MARRPATPWPTETGSVFFDDVAAAPTISRAVAANRIRRIATKLYTADLRMSAESLVERNRWKILAHFIPDALIADRSAAESGPASGVLFIVSALRATTLKLPGLVIEPRKGHEPLDDDPPWASGLRVTSDARTLVENIALSRARKKVPARTYSIEELEDWLANKTQLRGEGWLDQLRDRAIQLSGELGVPDREERIRQLVSMAKGSRPVGARGGRLLAARQGGTAWDPQRIERLDELAAFLSAIPGRLDVPGYLPPPAGDDGAIQPFFEAYFSNFIEGTEFTVEEAEEIVNSGTPPVDRPADGHDIIGTFRVVSDLVGRATVPRDGEELMHLLKQRHHSIMEGRPEKRPGEWKARSNQAGSYVFIDKDLVEGTLVEGLKRVENLPPGFARAAYVLFLVSEVHPFEDGNGRVSRTAMCAELSATDQARILIPIVFRTEYLDALRALSRYGQCDLYVRMLAHAWRWTAAMPWSDRAAVDGRMQATNALLDSTDAAQTGKRLELP